MNEQLGPLEIRAAVQTGVSYAQRLIELIVMPYDTETIVEHRGKLVREVIARGAFDGIERRANRIKVNRDHDLQRTVGKTVSLHPSRIEGLVAEVRIAGTEARRRNVGGSRTKGSWTRRRGSARCPAGSNGRPSTSAA